MARQVGERGEDVDETRDPRAATRQWWREWGWIIGEDVGRHQGMGAAVPDRLTNKRVPGGGGHTHTHTQQNKTKF